MIACGRMFVSPHASAVFLLCTPSPSLPFSVLGRQGGGHSAEQEHRRFDRSGDRQGVEVALSVLMEQLLNQVPLNEWELNPAVT